VKRRVGDGQETRSHECRRCDRRVVIARDRVGVRLDEPVDGVEVALSFAPQVLFDAPSSGFVSA
jgi:hypothetical protein